MVIVAAANVLSGRAMSVIEALPHALHSKGEQTNLSFFPPCPMIKKYALDSS